MRLIWYEIQLRHVEDKNKESIVSPNYAPFYEGIW